HEFSAANYLAPIDNSRTNAESAVNHIISNQAYQQQLMYRIYRCNVSSHRQPHRQATWTPLCSPAKHGQARETRHYIGV
ncbi:hypothetical protein V2G26_013905, partial [Clonostachys chloroleuca]